MQMSINTSKSMCLTTMIIAYSIFTVSSHVTINGNFRKCVLTEPQHHVSLNTLCDDDGISIQQEDFQGDPNNSCKDCIPKDLLSATVSTALIFIKHHFLIQGHGYKCSMKINTLTWDNDFIGEVHKSTSFRLVPLTRFDCLNMIEADVCGEEKMNCNSKEECYYETPEHKMEQPKWMRSIQNTQNVCSYTRVNVLGKSEDSKLFKDAKSKCTANELECVLDHSIVIWNKEIVKRCIFESVLYIDDLTSPYHGKNNVFESKKNRFLFKLTNEIETACDGIHFIKSLEGLYLVPLTENNRHHDAIQLPKSSVSIEHLQDNDLREFMLAEVDFDKRNLLSTISRTACSSLINTIRSHIDAQDKFIVISEFGLTDAVLYINDGLAYLPVCTNVSTIQILSTTSECYRDFAVKYTVGNNEINGFLRHSNILSHFSEQVECDSNDRSLVIEGSSIKIKRKQKNVTIENFDNNLVTKLRMPLLEEGSLNEIFMHHQLLINSTGTIDHIEELFASKEHEDIFYVRGSSGSRINSVSQVNGAVGLIHRGVEYLRSLSTEIWNTLIYIVFALAIVFCLLIILRCICCKKRCSRPRYNRVPQFWRAGFTRARPEAVELQQLS
jgi:hypothetical protein